MKTLLVHLTALVFVVGLGLVLGPRDLAYATPCAGCAGSCSGSSDQTCGCVTIEGCTCCGGLSNLSAGPSSSTASKTCVKDQRGAMRCGEKVAQGARPQGPQTLGAPARGKPMPPEFIRALKSGDKAQIKRAAGQLDLGTAPPGPSKFVCDSTSCTCDGAKDCLKLVDSNKCGSPFTCTDDGQECTCSK